MALEVGSIVEGVITGITGFGAFVDLGEGIVGLVHISEVAHGYVEDINRHLKEGEKVKVKILGINQKGKYDLSIKQTMKAENPRGGFDKSPRAAKGFEDMMSSFLKESTERQLDLKKSAEGKLGGRRSR
ncbi:MAG: S1 RNA-binding domain-containing protein [Chloroflexi bacterium]|nr:S1 RNA-binding domain-containing protein [Chloroflexota bacterium]